MGKTAIVYYSQHHGNTKKVLDAIADYDNDVTLVDVTEKHEVDLTGYDRIGFASGIYFGKVAEQLHNFAKRSLKCCDEIVKNVSGLFWPARLLG